VFAAPATSTPVTAPPVTAPPITAPHVKDTPVAPAVPVAETYHYDSSYQPSVEKISEAHKAARFAVGALAFDDVVVAVDHLKRALDLLTNPVAKTH
jgi:vacuolar protein sorting-associated protein VTA1